MFSLTYCSDSQSQYGSRVSYKDGCCWPVQETSDDKQLITGADTSIIYFNREAAKSSTHENKDTSTSLPSWLQQYKEDTRRNPIDNQVNFHHKSQLITTNYLVIKSLFFHLDLKLISHKVWWVWRDPPF